METKICSLCKKEVEIIRVPHPLYAIFNSKGAPVYSDHYCALAKMGVHPIDGNFKQLIK